jgi:hypothetical protein
VVAVMLVALTTTTFVAAAPPIVTVAPLRKFVPLMVTDVPPAMGPDAGEMLPTVGAGFRASAAPMLALIKTVTVRAFLTALLHV